MKCAALLLLAAPVALASSPYGQPYLAPFTRAQRILSELGHISGRHLHEAEVMEEERAVEPEADAEAEDDDEAVPAVEEPTDTTSAPDPPADNPAEVPNEPGQFGQFPARDSPFAPPAPTAGSTCQPYIKVPAASTECSAVAYRSETQCVVVPGCTWTAANNLCSGGFDPLACADLTPEVCLQSFFCTEDDVYATFGSPNRAADPLAPPTPPTAPAPVVGGGGGQPAVEEPEDVSTTKRDSVGPGGTSIDSDGAVGVLSWSPVPERPETPPPAVSAAQQLFSLSKVVMVVAWVVALVPY